MLLAAGLGALGVSVGVGFGALPALGEVLGRTGLAGAWWLVVLALLGAAVLIGSSFLPRH